MKAISEGIYQRGKHGTKYVRRRIPADIRAASPPSPEYIVRSLGTADLREAKERARVQLTRIDTEFRLKRQELDLNRVSSNPKRVARLDDEQLQSVARFRGHRVLLNNERSRQDGMDDTEFDELNERLVSQRGELVDTEKVAPAVTHPLNVVAPERAPANPEEPTWEKVFETWRDYVKDRPTTTTIASQTPWRDLRQFVEAHEVRIVLLSCSGRWA